MLNCLKLFPAVGLLLFCNLLPAEQPNIIWIVADDLGYNDLSCMGQTNFETPNIDQMAKEGTKFTQFYSGCTVCAPSRACFLTGLHTGHVFQRFNGPIQFREDPLDQTVASFLQNAGYKTAMIGKSGLSCNSEDGGLPNRKGFDYFFGFVSHREAHRYYPKQLWRNDQLISYPGNKGFEGDTYSGDEMLQESLNWISANKDHPFFLHMSLQQPHADSAVPEAYRQKFLGKFGEEKPYGEGNHYRPEPAPKATVAGMISYLDDSVGKVVDKVKELGIEKNTIIMFTSDNGPHREGGHHPDHFDSNGSLRGGKRDMYEGGIRVPLIVWGPGQVRAGQTTDLISAFWDFPVTACQLAGIEMPVNHDGISMVPTLTGQGTQEHHKYLYWEFYEQGGKQAIRAGKWKAIRLQVGKDREGPVELYDLENDLGETTNVASANPEVAIRMAELMKEAHTPSDVVKFTDGNKDKPKKKTGKRIQSGQVLDRDTWKIIDVDSESTHNGKLIGNIIDGSPNSVWHTQWQGESPGHPHWFIIDLGASQTVSGIRVMNRQTGNNGSIADFEVFLSETPEFTEPVHSGTFRNTPDEQRSEFEEPVVGRYLKLVAKSEVAGRKFTSLAEFNVETPDKR